MEIDELLKFRETLSIDSRDEDGYISSQLLLRNILPSMLDTKLVDSDDYEECFHTLEKTTASIDGHTFNESQERLQILAVDKNTTNEALSEDDLQVSERKFYEKSFNEISRFIKSSINGHMTDKLQDSSTAKLLVHILNSSEGLEQIDVIEIFLVSLTATVSFRGNETIVRNIHFEEESIPVKYSIDGQEKKKNILIIRKLIDLNFLYNVEISKGNGDPLEVRFESLIGQGVDVLEAASESHFKSYLCVLPANVLVELYRRYSSRLLEKNVRSFLQFKGVNAGIKKTIRDCPEKFIAYNNGLTITASNANISSKKGVTQILSLTDFQIVNGGQTTATIYFSKKEGLDVSKVKVMAKINVAQSHSYEELDKLIAEISRFSNAQSRVSNVDLDSRSPELIILKKLSQTVNTPSGKKWFFERSKGEYQTLLRKEGKKASNDYPNSRRFSKEMLAKYHAAWGDVPYKVKKGGEKIFRHFIEELDNGIKGKKVTVDRTFYENTIAKIILFTGMEKIYGSGKNSMGQLRSAVIPYTLSILHRFTDYTNKIVFDMEKIWKHESINSDLEEYLKDLMLLLNELIKKYSLSEDFGEYSKKEQLWNDIASSKEILTFMSNDKSKNILKKYTKISK